MSFVDIPSTGEARDHDDVAVTNAAGGVVVLAANQHRKSALIINTGAEDIRVTTDGSTPTATRGKLIPAGSALSMGPPYCPTLDVRAFCPVAAGSTVNPSEVD